MPRDGTRDIVRGLTCLEMSFVNISSLRCLQHSPYIGQITYSDTIFPCFAFLSGMSPTPVRRSVGLVGIGLGLNTLGAFINGQPKVRIPGVLQRLGLASLVANAPQLALLKSHQAETLILLWYAITLFGASTTSTKNPLAHPDFPNADAEGTAQTRIDRSLFGQGIYTPTYDPEGLLGALTTAASMLIGQTFQSAGLTASEKLMASAGMVGVGQALHYLVPKYGAISKSLWTPSFVLVTSGVSIMKYLAVEKLIPYLPTAVQSILAAVGERSLEVYVFSTLVIMAMKVGGERSLMTRSTRFIGRVTSLSVADGIVSMGFTGVVAASAKFMVSQNLRLRW